MATPEDIDHAQIYSHVADVLEDEFPAHQGWRATPAQIAADVRTREIIERVRAMAGMAEQRMRVRVEMRYQARVTGVLNGQLVFTAIEVPARDLDDSAKLEWSALARQRFAEKHPEATIRRVRFIEYSNVIGEMRTTS